MGSTLKMDSERPYVSTYTTLFTLPKIGSQFFSSNYALLTCYYILQMCDEAFHLSLPFFQKRIYIVSYVCRRKSKELISKIYQQREHISKLKNESPKLHHSTSRRAIDLIRLLLLLTLFWEKHCIFCFNILMENFCQNSFDFSYIFSILGTYYYYMYILVIFRFIV